MKFSITQEVEDIGIAGAYFVLRGVANRALDQGFEVVKKKRLEKVLENLSSESIESNQVLVGFRDLHKAVGKSSKKYVSSSENLLKFLLKNKNLPSVNLLVDIYNLISVESCLALGAHDLDHINDRITLKITDGTEEYWPLGYGKQKPVSSGDYAYVDGGNEVICWMEVRQVEKTKVTNDISDVFYIVQGNASTDIGTLKNVTNNLIELTKEYCGGEVEFLYTSWK